MRLVRYVAAGALSGGIGTVALDTLQYASYRRDDGKLGAWRWEFGRNVMSWDQASAPGQLARHALRRITGDEPPESWARPATNIVHWATGVGWGAAFGAVAAATSRRSWARTLALGPIAWLSGYVVLPLAGVYKPIWEYDARTLAKDLSGHLAYGATTSSCFWAITKSSSRRERP